MRIGVPGSGQLGPLRARAGRPLGPARAIGHSAMPNLIGDLPDPSAVLAVPGAHLRL